MPLFLRIFLLSFLPLIHICSTSAMLVFGQTALSPDRKRYIAYLGHHHEQTNTDIEARQLEALVAICRQGILEGKKFHILYERTGEMIKFLIPRKTVLGDLEETFAAAQITDCTVENIEIRDCGAAAGHIFYYKGNVLHPRLAWNKKSKAFDELTFQDVFDEFEKYAAELEPFIHRIVQENTECPHTFLITSKLSQAWEALNCIKTFLQENTISTQTSLLKLARERKNDCNALEMTTDHAFSDLFDLHIFRRITQLDPNVQVVVVAGGKHALEVEQLFGHLRWETNLIIGNMYAEVPIPLDYDYLRTIILNETEWARFSKDTFKYLASLKVTIESQFNTLRESILSTYCKYT